MYQIVESDNGRKPLGLPCIRHGNTPPDWTVVRKMLRRTSQVLWDPLSMPQVVGPDICHMPLVLPCILRESMQPQSTVVRRISSRTSQVVLDLHVFQQEVSTQL